MSEETKQNFNWGLIIGDMVKLMIIVGCVGVVCKFGIAMFERVSPSEDLVSIVNKNKMTEQGTNQDFLTEIANGKESYSNFINCRDSNGVTPLMWLSYANFNGTERDEAKDKDRYYYVKHLLDQPDIDIHAKDGTGMTALHWASWSGLTHCSAMLIKAGLDINEPESKGYTPLMLAALRGNSAEVDMLLALGADPSAKNTAGLTAYDLAVKNRDSYSQRNSKVYQLIYSESRDKGHQKCVESLLNPEKLADSLNLDELVAEHAKVQETHLIQYASKAAQEKAAAEADAAGEVVLQTETPLQKYMPLWKVLAVIFVLPVMALVLVRLVPSVPTEKA